MAQEHSKPFLRRHLVLRVVHGRWRLFSCLALGLIVGLLTPAAFEVATRLLIGWNAGVWSYLFLSMPHAGASGATIRSRAIQQDEGRFAILGFCTLAAGFSVAAIIVELAGVKEMRGAERQLHIALAIATIVGSWFFTHLMFALHYAHEYFIERGHDLQLPPDQRGGIRFPGDDKPDFSDFLYFSFVIGVAAQTADVSITSKEMRRISLVHSVIAFFFNTAIVALMINIASSLVSG